jgi:hypothetical protein
MYDYTEKPATEGSGKHSVSYRFKDEFASMNTYPSPFQYLMNPSTVCDDVFVKIVL